MGPSTGNVIADHIACPGCVALSEIARAREALATVAGMEGGDADLKQWMLALADALVSEARFADIDCAVWKRDIAQRIRRIVEPGT